MKLPLEVLRLYPEHDYTLRGAFESRAQRDGSRPFLLFAGRTWSWSEFGAAAENTARLFVAHGIRKGDRVAVMARNHEGHVLALFGLARIGAILVLVNPEFGVEEARYVLHHAGVSGVIASSDTIHTARTACQDLTPAPWFVLLDAVHDDAPLLQELIESTPERGAGIGATRSRGPVKRGAGAPSSGMRPLNRPWARQLPSPRVSAVGSQRVPPPRIDAPVHGDATVEAGIAADATLPDSSYSPPGGRAPDIVLPEEVTADTTCLIVYTSGTTGFPKGAMHSQRSFVIGGEAFVQRVHLQEDDRVMIILPLFHINALFYSVAGTLAAGCSMVVVPRFSASTFWDTALDTGATEINVIDAVGTILKNRPRSEYRPGHRIRKVYGARQGFFDAFRDEFGIAHLVGGFGMTEIPGVTCTPFEGPQKPGSMGPVGRHPDPARRWAECRVVDDEGRDVGVDEVGELAVKTPIIMQGYYRDPEQTRAAFRDGWFLTGDLVRRDADGWFYFVARKKDIIRRRGENISGAELDRVIGGHPAVHEAAAIAVPSELGEDEILVAVTLKPGQACSARDIAAWCRKHLAPQKVPRFVAFVEELPHTPTHKVAKQTLRTDSALKAKAVDLGAKN